MNAYMGPIGADGHLRGLPADEAPDRPHRVDAGRAERGRVRRRVDARAPRRDAPRLRQARGRASGLPSRADGRRTHAQPRDAGAGRREHHEVRHRGTMRSERAGTRRSGAQGDARRSGAARSETGGGAPTQVPIVRSVAFGYDDIDGWLDVARGEVPGHIYSRNTNPTVAVFEEKVRLLEGAEAATAFASGHGGDLRHAPDAALAGRPRRLDPRLLRRDEQALPGHPAEVRHRRDARRDDRSRRDRVRDRGRARRRSCTSRRRPTRRSRSSTSRASRAPATRSARPSSSTTRSRRRSISSRSSWGPISSSTARRRCSAATPTRSAA